MLCYFGDRKIKCIDCGDEELMTAPNHKRCRLCAHKMSLFRAREAMKKLSPEKNRENARSWYWQNRQYKLKKVKERHERLKEQNLWRKKLAQ